MTDAPEALAVAGATVTLNPETPAHALAKAAASDVVVTDERGRSIMLKKPGVLAQFRLVEALGNTAVNQVYMGMVLPMLYVAAIEGEPVMRPNSKGEVEALIQRLDEEGVQAVMLGVQEHFGVKDEEETKNA